MLDTTSKDYDTALILSAYNGHLPVVEVLISSGEINFWSVTGLLAKSTAKRADGTNNYSQSSAAPRPALKFCISLQPILIPVTEAHVSLVCPQIILTYVCRNCLQSVVHTALELGIMQAVNTQLCRNRLTAQHCNISCSQYHCDWIRCQLEYQRQVW